MKARTTSRFKKAFDTLPSNIQQRAIKQVRLFEQNPRHPGWRTHRLQGRLKGLNSFSVTQSYRVLFMYVGRDEVLLLDIGTHEVYRK